MVDTVRIFNLNVVYWCPLTTPSKVFGSHRLPSKGQFRVAGSSVHKLAIQRAARESANQPGA